MGEPVDGNSRRSWGSFCAQSMPQELHVVKPRRRPSRADVAPWPPAGNAIRAQRVSSSGSLQRADRIQYARGLLRGKPEPADGGAQPRHSLRVSVDMVDDSVPPRWSASQPMSAASISVMSDGELDALAAGGDGARGGARGKKSAFADEEGFETAPTQEERTMQRLRDYERQHPEMGSCSSSSGGGGDDDCSAVLDCIACTSDIDGERYALSDMSAWKGVMELINKGWYVGSGDMTALCIKVSCHYRKHVREPANSANMGREPLPDWTPTQVFTHFKKHQRDPALRWRETQVQLLEMMQTLYDSAFMRRIDNHADQRVRKDNAALFIRTHQAYMRTETHGSAHGKQPATVAAAARPAVRVPETLYSGGSRAPHGGKK